MTVDERNSLKSLIEHLEKLARERECRSFPGELGHEVAEAYRYAMKLVEEQLRVHGR